MHYKTWRRRRYEIVVTCGRKRVVSELYLQSGEEGALIQDGDGAEGGVAAYGLGIPMDGVPQQLGNQIDSLYEDVYLPVVPPAVRYPQSALRDKESHFLAIPK